MKVKVGNIKPNPFRRMEEYPINRAKVETLKKSIESTSFWDNIVARKNGSGVEIAYGHHRLVALQELYPPDKEINLITRKIDDSLMIRIMANENLEEWSSDAFVTMEAVAAVVSAFAKGKIKLEEPKTGFVQGSNLRYAPSYLIHTKSDDGESQRARVAYNATTIANFLGWEDCARIKDALRALELEERTYFKRKDLEGLTLRQVRSVSAEAQRTVTQSRNVRVRQGARKGASEREVERRVAADVRHVVSDVVEAFKGGKLSTNQASVVGARSRSRLLKKRRKLPDIGSFAISVCNQLSGVLKKGTLLDKLKEVMSHKKHLTDEQRKALKKDLEQLSKRAMDYAKRL